MRGLPFNAQKAQILEFLNGIDVVNGRNGIFLVKVILLVLTGRPGCPVRLRL